MKELPKLDGMLAGGKRWLLPLLLLGAPCMAFLAAVYDERWWFWLGVSHLRPDYADLVAILAAGEAHRAGLNVFADNPFDPFGRPHVYGPWWLVTGDMGLTIGDALWLGPLLVGLFVIVAAGVMAPYRPSALGFAIVLLVGPPVMLALERGNNDLIMFLLMAAAAWLVSRKTILTRATGGMLIVTAAALKVYPAAALLVLLMPDHIRFSRLILLTVAIGVGGAIAWIWRTDYQQMLALTPAPRTIFSYGARVSGLTWLGFPATRGWLVAGAALAALAFVRVGWRHWRALWHMVPLQGFSTATFVAGAAAWITCYELAINYSYRLVLLLLPARLWLSAETKTSNGMLARVQLCGWGIVFWLPLVKPALGAAALKPGSSYAPQILSLVLGFEQTTTFLLSGTLVISLAGWLSRSLCMANLLGLPPDQCAVSDA